MKKIVINRSGGRTLVLWLEDVSLENIERVLEHVRRLES